MRLAVPCLLLVACAVPEFRGGVGTQCVRNSDCAAPLVCRIGYCRRECRTSADCLAPAACVEDEDGLGACQLPAEQSCALQSDCPAPLVCRFHACVNACVEDRDCPPGQRCRDDPMGNGCVEDIRGDGCIHHGDCPGDLVCTRDATCREECRADRDCRTNRPCEDGGTCTRTACLDPDGDGLGACLFRCTGDDDCSAIATTSVGAWACAPRAAGDSDACRPTCPDGTCPGTGWSCETRADGVRYCDPLIPDPLADGGVSPAMDGGAVRDGGAGTDAGTRTDGGTGIDGGTGMDGGTSIDGGPPPCGGGPLTGIVDLSLGGNGGCAVRGSGATTEVLCWGSFGSGSCPVAMSGLDGLDIRDIELGGVHGCVVLADGTVQCWGVNNSGELGRGTITTVREPIGPVPGITNAAGVTADWTTTCVWRTGMDASCWGSNLWGTLGGGPCRACGTFVSGAAGGDFPSPRPVTVVSQPQSLSAHGGAQVCGIVAGRVECWGKSGEGQLGMAGGTMIDDAIDVAAGAYFSCAVRGGDGTVQCWGQNLYGGLGDGTMTDRPAIGPVLGLPGPAVNVDADEHACAVLADGSVWCWGKARSGRVRPDLDVDAEPVPQRVITSGATFVEVGLFHSCALVAGEVQCWGLNSSGQLGDGTTTARTTVRTVLAP